MSVRGEEDSDLDREGEGLMGHGVIPDLQEATEGMACLSEAIMLTTTE